MAKVTLSGHILVPEAELALVQEALVEHIVRTLAEPGCLVFQVTQDTEEPQRFHVYEEFVDAEAFAHHQARVKSSPWGAVTTNVERHYQITGLDES